MTPTPGSPCLEGDQGNVTTAAMPGAVSLNQAGRPALPNLPAGVLHCPTSPEVAGQPGPGTGAQTSGGLGSIPSS